jgi:glycine/D-amino acid oxidase-like deaminating enzyme
VSFSPLDSDGQVDVAIIGAGITGLTAALHLKRAGKKVAVLEAGRVAAGTSGGTSAHLEVMPDQGFVQLERDFSADIAASVTRARAEAIDQIENWVAQLGIDCDFRRVPGRAYTERRERAEHIQAELEAAQRLGLSVTFQPSAGLPFPTAAALEIRNQARFHAVKYLRGLARAVHGDNASIYERTRAEPPEEDDGQCVVRANGQRVVATDLILATHSAFLGISQFDMRQAPYQSYVLAARVQEEIPDALYWDDEEPYHYVRWASSAHPRLLIVGGADHKTGQAPASDHIRQLEQYVQQRFTTVSIEQRWSAEYFEPADGLSSSQAVGSGEGSHQREPECRQTLRRGPLCGPARHVAR